jgi:hypothetical protein
MKRYGIEGKGETKGETEGGCHVKTNKPEEKKAEEKKGGAVITETYVL